MTGDERRESILNVISHQTRPINALKLAEHFGVSRQIIVGDIALLRAKGHEIITTKRGYLTSRYEHLYIRKIAVSHTPEQTELELNLLIGLGIVVVDVIVEHPVYGEITGQLDIRNEKDIQKFLSSIKDKKTCLLSEINNGIHLHTLACPNERIYKKAKEILKKYQILYESN